MIKLNFLLFILLILFSFSCSETPNTNVCEDIVCSGHGVCGADVNGDPSCVCDSGYYADGVNCKSKSCTPACNKFQNCNINSNSCSCKTDYLLKDGNCIYDCSLITNSIVNNDNNGCLCKAGSVLEGSTCVEQIDLCSNVTCDNWESCNQANGQCELNDNKCNTVNDCSGTEICDNHSCVEQIDLCSDITCDNWKNCNPENGNCELLDNKCDTTNDCSGTEICDNAHSCLEPNDPCLNVTCDSWKKCNPANLLCELLDNKCDTIDDCSDNEVCESHSCKTPTDPCLSVSCGNGNCVNNNGTASCDCNNGYQASGLSCIDINECTNNTNNCDSNATCNNTQGSFDCSCNLGYSGSGITCTEDNQGDITPIHTIRQTGVVDTSYKTVGVITAINGNSFWFQEKNSNNYSAIYCYQCGNRQVGNEVEVTANYTIFYDLSELKNVDSLVLKTQSVQLPQFKDVDAINITNMEPQESMLVNFLNPPFEVTEAPTSTNYWNTIVKDSNNRTFKIRGTIFHFTNPAVGDIYNRLRGILTYDHGEYKLYPTDLSDMNTSNVCENISCSNQGECVINDGIASCNCYTGYHSSGNNCLIDDPTLCDDVTCSNHGECQIISNQAICSCDSGYHAEGLTCIEGSIETHLRLMAANTTSGNGQSYMEPGIRMFKALKPDVVMIQEFNYDSGSIRELVDEAFGTAFGYILGNGSIPNGIVSRYVIYEFGFWNDPNIPNRDLDWAIVDIPGDKDLFVISVHLHTSPSSDQVIAAQVIAQKVANHRSTHQNEFYYVVGGDFNGSSAVSSNGFGSYNGESVFVINGSSPRGEDGKVGTNASRKSHYDWILETQDFHMLQVPTKYCKTNNTNDCKIYNSGLVFDSRNFSQSELNDYFSPVQTSDSGASNMQHMGIIKDYIIE